MVATTILRRQSSTGMSQSSSPSSVIVSMMSPLPTPSAAALLPSALREKRKAAAAATTAERKHNPVTFSQPQHHNINSRAHRETSSDNDASNTTTAASKPQQHVEEMVLRLQRQAERTIQLDQHHKQADLADDDLDFPRIPATCDELDHDDDDDDDEESLTSDDNSSSSDSSCGEATDEEEEDRIVKQLVEHAFNRKRKVATTTVPSVITASSDTASISSSQSTASLLTAPDLPSQNPFKKQRLPIGHGVTTPLPPLPCPREVASDAFRTYARRRSSSQEQQQLGRGLSFSLSEPNLVGRASPSRRAAKTPSPAQLSPQDFLRHMHHKAGVAMAAMRPAHSIPNFFVKGSQEEYDMTIVQAVRSANLELLKQLKTEQGRNLQCCNKFGESIVHTVARHGLVSVLELLLELDVSVQVCCDSGRSPLSDACWTQVPKAATEGVVDVLLDTCPDLLYVTDRRGLSPLSYVPREHWESWCRYLENRGLDKLQPKSIRVEAAPQVVVG